MHAAGFRFEFCRLILLLFSTPRYYEYLSNEKKRQVHNENLLKAIQDMGFETPSEVQEKAIPILLEKDTDIVSLAQTGTGKTAGFTLPLLQRLSKQKHHPSRSVRALILTPTRELASQVYENVQEYSLFSDLKSTVIFGGVNQKPQVKKINKGIDVLVATPGRLLDLYRQKVLFFDKVEICGRISFAPKAQLSPTLKRSMWDIEAQKASTVCPDNVRPLASVIVPETITGR